MQAAEKVAAGGSRRRGELRTIGLAARICGAQCAATPLSKRSWSGAPSSVIRERPTLASQLIRSSRRACAARVVSASRVCLRSPHPAARGQRAYHSRPPLNLAMSLHLLPRADADRPCQTRNPRLVSAVVRPGSAAGRACPARPVRWSSSRWSPSPSASPVSVLPSSPRSWPGQSGPASVSPRTGCPGHPPSSPGSSARGNGGRGPSFHPHGSRASSSDPGHGSAWAGDRVADGDALTRGDAIVVGEPSGRRRLPPRGRHAL